MIPKFTAFAALSIATSIASAGDSGTVQVWGGHSNSSSKTIVAGGCYQKPSHCSTSKVVVVKECKPKYCPEPEVVVVKECKPKYCPKPKVVIVEEEEEEEAPVYIKRVTVKKCAPEPEYCPKKKVIVEEVEYEHHSAPAKKVIVEECHSYSTSGSNCYPKHSVSNCSSGGYGGHGYKSRY